MMHFNIIVNLQNNNERMYKSQEEMRSRYSIFRFPIQCSFHWNLRVFSLNHLLVSLLYAAFISLIYALIISFPLLRALMFHHFCFYNIYTYTQAFWGCVLSFLTSCLIQEFKLLVFNLSTFVILAVKATHFPLWALSLSFILVQC